MDVEHTSPIAEVCASLAGGHEQMERLIDDILSAPGDETEPVRSLWLPFAAILAAHLDEEDRLLIPALVRVAERQARGLVLEHRHLRARIAQIDLAFSAGTLAARGVRAFAEEVLAHHRREGALLARLAPAEVDAE